MQTIKKFYSKIFNTEISDYETILLSVAAILVAGSVAYIENTVVKKGKPSRLTLVVFMHPLTWLRIQVKQAPILISAFGL